LAQSQYIPEKFLQNILTQLCKAEIVYSRRGADGGYRLARPAGDIMVIDIFRAVRDPISSAPDLALPESDRAGDQVSTRALRALLQAAVYRSLQGITVDELVTSARLAVGPWGGDWFVKDRLRSR
jgi:Rrf2 family protein